MQLSIADMRSVLKTRVDSLVNKKASDEPADILAGIKDAKTILDEMEKYATDLAREIEIAREN